MIECRSQIGHETRDLNRWSDSACLSRSWCRQVSELPLTVPSPRVPRAVKVGHQLQADFPKSRHARIPRQHNLLSPARFRMPWPADNNPAQQWRPRRSLQTLPDILRSSRPPVPNRVGETRTCGRFEGAMRARTRKPLGLARQNLAGIHDVLGVQCSLDCSHILRGGAQFLDKVWPFALTDSVFTCAGAFH